MLMLFAELKRCLVAQREIDEGFLHQALAIVEGSVDAQRDDIVAPAGELLLLARAHQPFRVQDHDSHPRPQVKRRGDGAAGVARGRDQDGHRRLGTALQARSVSAKKARSEILESRGRTVKQLEHEQRVRAPIDRGRRRRKIERRLGDVGEHGLQPVARRKNRRASGARSRAAASPPQTPRGRLAATGSARTSRRRAPNLAGWRRSRRPPARRPASLRK